MQPLVSQPWCSTLEDAFRDESGRLLLSRTAVSEIGARLWADYQEFARRDLSEYDITYLFVDGIAERLRPGQRREPVRAALGHTSSGAKVLPHLMAGSKEDAETVTAFFQDMRARGLGDPLLVVSDGAPGIVKALETCFPRSERQRCLAHRMRNLAAKVPEDRWPEFKARATACYQAPSRALARDLAAGVVADFATELATAVRCFTDDFEACIAHLRMPVTHRRAIRTTNLLERLFVEERRRLKIIANAFGEKPVLELMFGAMIRATERWRAVKVTEFERRQMAAVRQDLDQEYQARTGFKAKPSSEDSRAALRGRFVSQRLARGRDIGTGIMFDPSSARLVAPPTEVMNQGWQDASGICRAAPRQRWLLYEKLGSTRGRSTGNVPSRSTTLYLSVMAPA